MAKKNASGSGSLRKRPDGTWEARFTYTDELGQTKRKSVYGKTQKEVRQKMTAAQKEVDESTFKARKQITVAKWLAEWLANYGTSWKPNTLCTYQSRVEKDIIPYIGSVKLGDLTNLHIQKLLNKLEKGSSERKALAPKTVRSVHGILHKALHQAVVVGYIPTNPADNCKLPKLTKPELSPIMDEDLKRFVRAIHGHEYENLFMLALFSGMREAEICGLQWSDVDWENGLITVKRQYQRDLKGGGHRIVETPKNGRRRAVAVPPSIIQVLKREKVRQMEHQLKARELWANAKGWLFTDDAGQPVKPERVYKQYKKIVTALGLPDSRFHDLRHSYAINALAAGDNIKSVSDNLGHATTAFTMDVYGATSEAMRKQTQDIMEQVFKDASGR